MPKTKEGKKKILSPVQSSHLITYKLTRENQPMLFLSCFLVNFVPRGIFHRTRLHALSDPGRNHL